MKQAMGNQKIYMPSCLFSYKSVVKGIEMSNTKRIMVSFTEKQWEMLQKLRGEFGDNDANIVRGIVLAWLAEKSFIADSAKERMEIKS